MEALSVELKELSGGIKIKEKTFVGSKCYECKLCKDTGFIVVNTKSLPKLVPCSSCIEKWRMRRILKNSGITEYDYQRYTLEKFLTDTPEAIEMKELATKFLADEKAKGIGFFGRSGVGKTHICIGICQALNKEHRYWQYRREIQKLKNVMYTNRDEYEKLIDLAAKTPILYIDDLFKDAFDGKRIDRQDCQIMFQIINDRYIRELKTIISSEYSLNLIFKANEAIGSRIYEMIKPYVIKINGENRRIR